MWRSPPRGATIFLRKEPCCSGGALFRRRVGSHYRDGDASVGGRRFFLLLRLGANFTIAQLVNNPEVIQQADQETNGNDGEDELRQSGWRLWITHGKRRLRAGRQLGHLGQRSAEGHVHLYS